MTSPVSDRHDETRLKLIEAAGEVFAEGGYQAATVRDICGRAGANVAAVNYHFGDKLGLYTEALKRAVVKAERPAFEALSASNDPEQDLRRFLLLMFRQLHRVDRPAWCTKVMAHELAQPTAALAVVVEHVIRPNSLVLRGIVGRILGLPEDHRQTRLCVHSVIGQVMHYAHAGPVIALLWPDWEMTPEAVDEIANHVAEFSLAAMHSIKRKAQLTTAKPPRRSK